MAEGQASPETAAAEGVSSTEEKVPVEPQQEFEIVEWFKNKIKEACVTFVVYYRGFW